MQFLLSSPSSSAMNRLAKCTTLTGLRTCQCTESLLSQIRKKGFAVVQVDDSHLVEGLKTGISEARKLKTFRFPEPMDKEIIYNDEKRLAFRTLFEIAFVTLKAVVHHHATTAAAASTDGVIQNPTLSTCLSAALKDAIKQVDESKFELFVNNPHNEPFASIDDPFGATFFNLFNYSNGLLNPHVDRSLITVIYSVSPKKPIDQRRCISHLWVQDRNGTWHNADAALQEDDEVIVMMGEDLQQEVGDDIIYAAPHAVKVDAESEFISDSHFRPDPAQQQDYSSSSRIMEENHHRLSAAIILRHDPS